MKNIEKLLAAATILWTLSISSIIAQPRSMQELDAIANSVFSIGGARSANRMVMSITSSQVLKSIPKGQDEAFYIYTPAVGNKEGFVIVSGDKRMPAVLGYSDKNAFDATHIPDGLRWFFEKCQADMNLVSGGAAIVSSSVAQSATVAVAPLLGGRVWDQGKPFNNLCPEVSAGVRTVTGCTATAMAQIMAYHRHPAKGTGNISYTTPTFDYSVKANMDNASAYDWDNMLDSYDGTYNTTQAYAVAQLMFHAGAAITTDFCEISSGAETNSPEKAFVANFGYDDGIRIVRNSDCSNEVWNALLQQEIVASRPVLVSGFDNNGYGGHAFVFDGLDAEGNFHVNWGWSGLCDGYYNLYNLMPEESGIGGGFGEYNYNCQAIVGIHPEDGVKEADPTNIIVENTTSANGLGTFSLNTSISLNLRNFINMRHISFKGDAQLMLTDVEGNNIVTMLGSPLYINTPNGLPQNSYIESLSLTASLPADIADGDYRLYISVRQNGYGQWGRVRTLISDISNRYDYYELTVADGKYTLGTVSDEGENDNFEGVPTTISQISNGKAYTIHCERGSLGIQNERLVADSRSDITLETQKFLLYRYNDKFYLYNLEKQTFVGLDDNTDNSNRYAWTGVLPSKACISLEHSDNDAFPFIIRFGALWLNVYEGYDPGLVINAYTSKDEGNQFRLEPVEKVSEEVQESIKERLEAIMATEPRVILPWGKENAWQMRYRFTEVLDQYTEPAKDVAGRSWTDLDYDDSSWKTLTGPMANEGCSYSIYNYVWQGEYNCFNLRRVFHLADNPIGKYTFSMQHDDDIKVYVNGQLVVQEADWTDDRISTYEIPCGAFVKGYNILAIFIQQNWGGAFLDYSLSYTPIPNPYTDAQGVKYQLSAEDNTAMVIGHVTSVSKDLTIPLSIEGFRVTDIAAGAFADVDDLTSVTMLLEKPYDIPENAFSDAVYKHAHLIVPPGFESVYQNTAGWSRFNKVAFFAPNEYTDEQGVVYALNEDGETYMVKGYTENLVAKVIIPEMLHGKAVTVIDGQWWSGAFTGSSQLEEVVVSNSVTYIKDGAFNDCPNLKRVYIGSGVKNMVSGVIPGGIYQRGHNPFENCRSLESIIVDKNNQNFSSYNGMLYDKNQMILYAVPGSITSLAEDDLSPVVMMFDSYSLCGSAIEEAVIPAHVSIFDDACFQSCDRLKSLTILSHATNFCNTIFRYCSALEHLYVHGYYPDRNFANGELLEYTKENCIVHVPKGMKQVYLDKMTECGRMRTVVDDIEPATALDVDYSLGYDVKNLGFNAPKLGVGLLLTKEEAKAYAGCQITSVHFCIHPWGDSELSAFITKGVGGERMAYTAMQTSSFDGWRKLVFDTPYTITGEEELFIGMNSSTSTGVNYTNMQAPEGKLWFDWGGLEGTNWQPWSDAEGALAIAYTIEGDNLPANIRMTETTLTADEQGNHRIKGKLESCTIGLVDGCDIAYSINGGEPVTTHLDLQMVAKRHYEFEIPVKAEVNAGKNQVYVWVTKVGDCPDGIDSDSHAQFTLIGQNERYARKVVVEEGTGTWCGYCPRGIVGMRTMLENHPDNFIPIAIHDDNMASPSYSQIFGLLGGAFPSCTMNRKHFFDPNATDLEKHYLLDVNQAVARIKMNAQWADTDKKVVQIKTTSRFAYDMTEEFRIAYVVTESGVGPYPQANYFSGGEDMGGFEKEGEIVSIVHNHVARSISSLNGESGSVPVQPKGMTDYEYSYMLTLPDNIDNKENIQLIVLLINQETGEIVNADNVDVSGVKEYNSEDFTYTLTYMVDGEKYATEEIAYGETIVLKDAPKKEGYLFSGWSEVPETMPAHDVTVTGTFTANSYKVTYVLDGKTFKTETVTYGTAIPTPEVPAKEGYNFSGWGEIPATMPAKDLTFTGSYTINKDLKYNLFYMVDGTEYKRVTLSFMDKITLETAPTKEGHTFSGWSEVPETMPLHDVTVTGTFTANSYMLTYVLDGEIFKTETVVYGTAVTAPEAPVKEGHTFGGWTNVPATMPAKDVTVTGTYTINKYTLTYMVDGTVYKTSELEYGATITAEAAPIKEGYLFSGWSEIPETMPAKDIEVTGHFEVDGIDAVLTDQLVDVYTLQGVMLKRQISVDELKHELSRGIYIINGKKVVVR